MSGLDEINSGISNFKFQHILWKEEGRSKSGWVVLKAGHTQIFNFNLIYLYSSLYFYAPLYNFTLVGIDKLSNKVTAIKYTWDWSIRHNQYMTVKSSTKRRHG